MARVEHNNRLIAGNLGVGQVGAVSGRAQAEITSTTKGFLMPRMTTAQRLAIAAVAGDVGLRVYDITTNTFWYWDGNIWVQDGAFDIIADWEATTDYTSNQEITAVSPTTGHTTLYRRTAAGTSGATFNVAEEANWSPIASLGTNRSFVDDTTLTPTIAGSPTVAEITAYINTQSIADGLVYYTGNDTATDAPTHVYWVDASGVVTLLNSNVTNRYTETFDASLETLGTAKTITHSLNEVNTIVQMKDEATGEKIDIDINNYTTNSVDVTFNGALPGGNVTIIVM